MTENSREMTAAQRAELLQALQARFEANRGRHAAIEWPAVHKRLVADPAKLWALWQMEASGGEPDVTGWDDAAEAYIFCDCAPETPAGRRNLCYDDEALQARKANKPAGSAVGRATAMGIHLLNEEQYMALQQLGEFDRTTSSWVVTPKPVRSLGGALFCDRRFGRVFVYHNGADSYYAARGFRGMLLV